MTYAIVYSSRTGNTKMLAEAVKRALPAESCSYFGEPCENALNADRLYIGFWTEQNTCDKKSANFLKTVENKEIFLFGTAGFIGDPRYIETILGNVRQCLGKGNKIIGTYICQGKMQPSVRQKYEKMLNSPNPEPNVQARIDNFDKALSHPDSADLAKLETLVKEG